MPLSLQHQIDLTYSSLPDQPPAHTPTQITMVKKLIELYLVTFQNYDYTATRNLVHKDYKQHNPLVGDGAESIIEFGELMKAAAAEQAKEAGKKVFEKPELRYKHLLVDGEFIVVHVHAVRWEGDLGMNIFDLFRYRDGLFVEHWDAIAEVRAECRN